MSATEIPHVGTLAGHIGSQAIQQILCGGKGDAPGCARCWVGTYRLSFGYAPPGTFLHLEAKVTKRRHYKQNGRGPKHPSRVSWVSWFVLFVTIMGTGPQNPKRRSPTCSHFT